MRIAVFDDYRVGLVEDDVIFDVTDAVVPNAGTAWPPVFMNTLIAGWPAAELRLRAARRAASAVPLASVRLMAPNPCPIHVIAAPANYRKHIAEMGAMAVTPKGKTSREQGFFLKSPASVTGCARGIELPRGSARRFDHESELAVVIGQTARNLPRAEAMGAVFGYTCLIDVTMRIDGEHSEERSMRKSFETFTPMGPWIVTADEVTDPGALRNELFVNGELRQQATTADMILDIAGLVEQASSVMTLHPGDVIATGTPQGIGPIEVGDLVTIRISEIGEMSVRVRETEFVPPCQF